MVIHPHPLTQAQSYNLSLRLASGRWFHLIHDDDAVAETFYVECERTIDQNPSVEAIFTGSWAGPDLRQPPQQVRVYHSKEAFEEKLLCYTPVHSFNACVVRLATLLKAGGFHPHLDQLLDRELWFRLVWIARIPYAVISKPLAFYRLNPKGQSARNAQNMLVCHEHIAFWRYLHRTLPSALRRQRSKDIDDTLHNGCEWTILVLWERRPPGWWLKSVLAALWLVRLRPSLRNIKTLLKVLTARV